MIKNEFISSIIKTANVMRQAAFVVDKSGKILKSTSHLAELLNYGNSLSADTSIFEINPHISFFHWKKLWKQLGQEKSIQSETEYLTKDEYLLPVQWQTILLENEGEQFAFSYLVNKLHQNRYRELLQLIASASQIGAWELDILNQKVILTEELKNILPLSFSSLQLTIDKFVSEISTYLSSEEINRLRDKLIQSIKEGFAFESDFLISDGTATNFKRMRLMAIPTQVEEQTVKIQGTIQDISTLTEKNEELYLTQFTMDNAADMIYWVRPDGTFAYVNQSVCDKLGYTRQELLNGLNATDLIPGLNAQSRAKLWETLRAKKILEQRTEIKCKDGKILPIRSTLNYLKYKDQEIDCIISRDISKEIRDAEVLQMNQTALENISEMIFWVREDGSFKFVNQATCNLLGYTKNELLQMNVWDIDPNFTKEAYAQSWQTIQTEGGLVAETLHRIKSGRLIPIEISANLTEYKGVKYNCAVGRNISERKKQEAQIHSMMDRLKSLTAELESDNASLKEELESKVNINEIISKSPNYRKVLQQVGQVADSSASVLIVGETGTGKELLAKAIHRLSEREDKPMIKVNCAALPESLFESELFGHEKGAFTGAIAQKKGRFELAHRGTIFLDELGEMPLDLQAKLLRVLQEGEFERVGGTQTIKVDVRVIAATNRDLEKMVEQKRFRQDLYYRLNVFPIVNPPLRDRRDDIPLLVRHFVKKYCQREGKTIEIIPKIVEETFMRYDFPGNIRELENIIERSVIITNGKRLRLAFELGNRKNKLKNAEFLSFEEMQRQHILTALERTNWRVTGPKGAARLLRMNDRTLASKMRKLGIQREVYG